MGHSSFRIKGKNVTLVTDPFDPEMVGLKLSKIEADLVTISHQHQDHNKVDLVTVGKRVIDGPGEYEISGTSIIGIQTFHDDQKGAERGQNTVFVIEMDGLRLCHLGDLGHLLSDQQIEEIGEIDILMIPVGGEYTIGPVDAVKVVHDIEPKLVIPMHFKVPGINEKIFEKLETVDAFVSQLGLPSTTESKLVVKDGELSVENQRIVILEKK